MNKKLELQNLIIEMSQDLACESLFEGTNLKNLVNQFKFSTFIPNKWFDWPKYSDAKIMIVGQDWGPYQVLQDKFITRYATESKKLDFDYDQFLFDTFSSRTEKFIIKSIEYWFQAEYSRKMSLNDWNNYFFTVAVMFCRSGKLFRGNSNFDSQKSLQVSKDYLKRQIEILKPEKIMALGDLALRQIFDIFEIEDKRKLSEIIFANDIFEVNNIQIIPNFHPAAHVGPKITKDRFREIVS